MSELTSGQDYVLFLKSHLLLGYRLSWYHRSIWQVTPEGIQGGCRDWDGTRPMPAERFFRDVPGSQR